MTGVGASDCNCEGHLLAIPDAGRFREAVAAAGGALEAGQSGPSAGEPRAERRLDG